MDIRRRFFDVCRRDFKHLQEYQSTKEIRGDNSAVHMDDAYLFECDKGVDRTLYRELYGLDVYQMLYYLTNLEFPTVVSRQILTSDLDEVNNDNGLPAILNAHACLVISDRTVGLELKSAFQNFLITDGGIHMEDGYRGRLEAGGYIHPEREICYHGRGYRGHLHRGGFQPGHE